MRLLRILKQHSSFWFRAYRLIVLRRTMGVIVMVAVVGTTIMPWQIAFQ